MAAVLAWLLGQFGGLSIGALAVTLTWFLSQVRQRRLDRVDRERAEREADEQRAKALQDTIQAHKDRADAYEDMHARKCEELEAAKAAIAETSISAVLAYDEVEDLKTRLAAHELSRKRLAECLLHIMMAATEVFCRARDLGTAFRREQERFRDKACRDLCDLYEIDHADFVQRALTKDFDGAEIEMLDVRIALMYVDEALLGSRVEYSSMFVNTCLPMKVMTLLRENKDLEGEQLLHAIRKLMARDETEVFEGRGGRPASTAEDDETEDD